MTIARPLVAAAAACLLAAAPAQTRLLRFPDLHGDRVVFTYGGDLWLAPLAGGHATRLTSAPKAAIAASRPALIPTGI